MTTKRITWPVAVAATVFALAIPGCSSSADQASTSAPTASVAPQPIHSTLINLQLPQGTKISSHADGVEIWQTPGTADQTVAAVKPQLPIGRDLDGLKWCGEKPLGASGVAWNWGGPAGSVVVEAPGDGGLRIERSAKPAAACGG